MTKRQARRQTGEIYTKSGSMGAELLGLKPPFGSAPYRPNKHFLYLKKGDNILNVGFGADYSAKKFIDLLIGNDEVHKTRGITGKEDTIVTSSDVIIRSETIDKILNYEYTKAEEEWELPESGSCGSSTQALRFRSLSLTERYEADDTPRESKVSTRTEKPERKPKPSKEGLVSIAEIAAELKMEAREARAILRQQKVEKPEAGWCWCKKDVENIRRVLNDNKG